MGVKFESYGDDGELAAAVAAGMAERLAAGGLTVALSGGRISLRVFAALAAARPRGLETARWFWADERCVPPDHEDSNFAVARAHFLEPAGVPSGRIHRIRGEDEPVAAAEAAAAELRRVAGVAHGAMPVLDLVLLGMGEDGHVASLFPGDEAALGNLEAVFLPVLDSPKPPPLRVSLGMGALVAAREVWVVVAGAGKDDALADALSAHGITPLARLLRARAETRILSTLAGPDQASAAGAVSA